MNPTMLALADLPVLGVSGWSGSGKTTLIESVVPVLCKEGLTVAVVKHDAHGINLDHLQKDSARLFASGADVCLNAPEERLVRTHGANERCFEGIVRDLASRYDCVLVEGYKDAPISKVWLQGPEKERPPEDAANLLARLPWGSSRTETLLGIFEDWLPRQWRNTPVYGCVLIGGKSRRMGKPKHLIEEGGETWLERILRPLKELTENRVIAGTGMIPDSLSPITRLHDVPDARGPLAGLLAAMRWAPWASWIVTACDLPNLNADALQWLLSTRCPGNWLTLPKLPESSRVEPLLARGS